MIQLLPIIELVLVLLVIVWGAWVLLKVTPND
jgi:hypothetical protein